MNIVRSCTNNDVHSRVGKQLLARCVCMNTAGSGKLCTLVLYIVYSGELNNVALKGVVCMPAALSAVSDYSYFLFHIDHHVLSRRSVLNLPIYAGTPAAIPAAVRAFDFAARFLTPRYR